MFPLSCSCTERCFPHFCLTPGAPLSFLGQKQVVPNAESPSYERREWLWVHTARRFPSPHCWCHPWRLCCCEYSKLCCHHRGCLRWGDPPTEGCDVGWNVMSNTNQCCADSPCELCSGSGCFLAEPFLKHPGGMIGWTSPPITVLHPLCHPDPRISLIIGSLAAGLHPFEGDGKLFKADSKHSVYPVLPTLVTLIWGGIALQLDTKMWVFPCG